MPFCPKSEARARDHLQKKSHNFLKKCANFPKNVANFQKNVANFQKKIPGPERSASQEGVSVVYTRLNAPGRNLRDNLANFFAEFSDFA